MTPEPGELYAAALVRGPLYLRAEDGTCRQLPLEQWLGPLGLADAGVLECARGPVLDVGCGPGRHVLALARRGVLAVGVDVTPAAVRHARARGAQVMLASVFAPLPGAGHWRTALLLDGNIGIGGRPVTLLGRLRSLLQPKGRVLCELDGPGVATRSELVALEDEHEARSTWFPWARVGVDGIEPVARRAGMNVEHTWEQDRRWFAQLVSVSPHRVEQQLDRQRLADEQPQYDGQSSG
jgi:SAM-dependent methyltransferase